MRKNKKNAERKMPTHGALKQFQADKELAKWTDMLKAPFQVSSGSSANKALYKSMMSKLKGKRFPECASEIVYQMKEKLGEDYKNLNAGDKKWWDSLFRQIKSKIW